MSAPLVPPAPQLLVACLCAEWCGACRAYRTAYEAVASHFAGRARFAWIDVEDESDALGALDVDDFPTLFIADGDRVAFFGAVTPQPQTAVRLIHRALHGELGAVEHPAVAGLAERVRAIVARGGA